MLRKRRPAAPEATLIRVLVSRCDIFDRDSLTFHSEEAEGHG